MTLPILPLEREIYVQQPRFLDYHWLDYALEQLEERFLNRGIVLQKTTDPDVLLEAATHFPGKVVTPYFDGVHLPFDEENAFAVIARGFDNKPLAINAARLEDTAFCSLADVLPKTLKTFADANSVTCEIGATQSPVLQNLQGRGVYYGELISNMKANSLSKDR
jgi:hypothetical protein